MKESKKEPCQLEKEWEKFLVQHKKEKEENLALVRYAMEENDRIKVRRFGDMKLIVGEPVGIDFYTESVCIRCEGGSQYWAFLTNVIEIVRW